MPYITAIGIKKKIKYFIKFHISIFIPIALT